MLNGTLTSILGRVARRTTYEVDFSGAVFLWIPIESPQDTVSKEYVSKRRPLELEPHPSESPNEGVGVVQGSLRVCLSMPASECIEQFGERKIRHWILVHRIGDRLKSADWHYDGKFAIQEHSYYRSPEFSSRTVYRLSG